MGERLKLREMNDFVCNRISPDSFKLAHANKGSPG